MGAHPLPSAGEILAIRGAPEAWAWLHLGVHALLFAALSAILVSWWIRPGGSRLIPAPLLRAALGAMVFVCAAAAHGGLAMLLASVAPRREALLEVTTDAVGGAAGLVVWSLLHPAHARRVARALGWLLHPAVTAPAGLLALEWSATGSPFAAARWVAVATAFALPAAAAWVLGVRHGRYSDADLSRREERPPLLALGAACAMAHLGCLWALGAPSAAVQCAAGIALGAVSAAAITWCGLKVSFHVSAAGAAAAALLFTAPRGAFPFALAAVVLTWARVRDNRHTPREVAAGWALALVVAALAFGRMHTLVLPGLRSVAAGVGF